MIVSGKNVGLFTAVSSFAAVFICVIRCELNKWNKCYCV